MSDTNTPNWTVGTYRVRANVNTGAVRTPGYPKHLMAGGHSMKSWSDVAAKSDTEAAVLKEWSLICQVCLSDDRRVRGHWVNAVLQFTPEDGDHWDTIEVARVGRELQNGHRSKRW